MKWYVFKKEFLGKKVGEKVQMSEAEAKGLLAEGTIEVVTDEDPTAAVAGKILETVLGKVTTIVDEALTQTATSIKSRNPTIVTKDVANVDNNFGYENLGEFARDVKSAGHKETPQRSERLLKCMGFDADAKKKDATGMNTQSLDDGGILIPPGFSNTLYMKTFQDSDLLSQLDIYNIAGNSMTFPRLKEDSRANGSRYGGIQSYWIDEAGKITASKPGFDRMTLTLKKLAALVYVTQEQLDDSGTALEQFLMNGVSAEIRFRLGDAIFNGNGVGMPLGILVAPANITIATESGQAAQTVVMANISKMWARCQATIRNTANWYINQDVEPQLDTLALAIGTGGSTVPMYLPPGGLTGVAPARLKGRPVKFLEWCPTLGTMGDITLFEPSTYCMITKGGIKTAMSMHLRFDYDESVFKFTYRCDGQPWWPKPLTPFKGSNTQSTIITLASR